MTMKSTISIEDSYSHKIAVFCTGFFSRRPQQPLKEHFQSPSPNNHDQNWHPLQTTTTTTTTATPPEDDRIHHYRMGSLYFWLFVLLLFFNTRTFPIYGFMPCTHMVRAILLISIVNVQIILTTDFGFEMDIIPVLNALPTFLFNFLCLYSEK